MSEERTTVTVAGQTPYDVLIGPGVIDRLAGLVTGSRQVGLIYPPTLAGAADRITEVLAGAGHGVLALPVPDGEDAKRLSVAGRCWDALGAAGFTRSDAIVGLGGGAVTDLAGWVAACWLRGVRVVHVPTTLLGMVDAAVGGKTGINTLAGKNLVGSFHPPAGVLCDLDILRKLPVAEYVPGLAEIVKAGFIADPVILDLIERDPTAAADPGAAVAAELVARSVRVKADVVGEDLTEVGRREMLNYGHTLGHAIERRERFGWRHGAAISVGLVYAARLGELAGRLDSATAARHAQVLRSLGLPTSYDADAFGELRETMTVDKKSRGSTLRFVVLDGLAQPGILDDPAEDLLETAYGAVAK
ncbi:MAG: 3-dehydroquinate synthase [Mycobacteriales bacterium]